MMASSHWRMMPFGRMAWEYPVMLELIPKYQQDPTALSRLGASLGHFCGTYPFYLVLSWLPLYLVRSRGYSPTSVARLGGFVYVLSAAICWGAVWLADRRIARGADPSPLRIAIIASSQFILSRVTYQARRGFPDRFDIP